MSELWEVFVYQIYQTTWLEFVAVIFGLLTVWYSKQENILVYPTGIVNVLIYVYIAFNYKLYADAGINAYYFFMSIYGWYHWKDTKDKNLDQIPITSSSRLEVTISLSIMLLSFLIIKFGLDFTDSDVPYWDSISTAAPITAMWLMARKKIEHWIFWIITDLIAVPLYMYKGLPLTSVQYFIWTIIAIWGYFSWRKKLMSYA